MNKLFKTVGTSFWGLQIAGWSAYAILIYVTFLTVAPEGRFLALLQIKLFRTAVGFGLSSLLRYVYRPIARRDSIAVLVTVGVTGSLLFGCLWTAIEQWFYWLVTPGYEIAAALPRTPRIALDYTITLLGWTALYFGIKYGRAWQNERERTLQAIALARQAQLDRLRYQINPHFLFNALNSIRATIDEDPLRAKRTITAFSEFLRFSLLADSSAICLLREELEALRNYLSIEKIRFEDKLEVRFDIAPHAEERGLPSFLIHPLVENAIKHGTMSATTPLTIVISARLADDRLRIEVANTGDWIEADGERTNGIGVGLNNVRERLGQLFPGQSRFGIEAADGWVRATIELPNR